MAADTSVQTIRDAAMPSPRILTPVLAIADKLAIVGGWLAAACLGLLVVLIVAEIVVAFTSKFFRDLPGDIPIAWEYSGYLSGTAFLTATAIALRAGGHIRVGVLIANTGPALRRILEIFCAALGSVMTVFLAWTLIRFTVQAAVGGQVSIDSYTPMWIPKALLAAGAVLLAVQMVARLIRSIAGIATEDESLKATGLSE
jgi:TRAP-type mannitol/chloroaromatic compound transport system permease small subunit